MEHKEDLQLPTEAPVTPESNADQPQALSQDMPEEAVVEPLGESTEAAEGDAPEEPEPMQSQESEEAAAPSQILEDEPESRNQEQVNEEAPVEEASDDNSCLELAEAPQEPAGDLPEEHAESEEVPAKESEESSAPLMTPQVADTEGEPEPESDAHQEPAEGPVPDAQEETGALPEEPVETEAQPEIEPEESTGKEATEEQASEAKAETASLAVSSLSTDHSDKQTVDEEEQSEQDEQVEQTSDNKSIAALEPTEASVQATEEVGSHQKPAEDAPKEHAEPEQLPAEVSNEEDTMVQEPEQLPAEESKESAASPAATPESGDKEPEDKEMPSAEVSEEDAHQDPAGASLEDKQESAVEPSAPSMATQSIQTVTEPEPQSEESTDKEGAEEKASETKAAGSLSADQSDKQTVEMEVQSGQEEQEEQSTGNEKSANSEDKTFQDAAPTTKTPALLKVASFAGLKSQDMSDGCQPIKPHCTHCAKSATSASLVWETMLFCNDKCLEKYTKEKLTKCTTCSKQCPLSTLGRYCVRFGDSVTQFCSSDCLDRHKKSLKLCSYCQQNLATRGGTTIVQNVQGKTREFCEHYCHQQFLLGLLSDEEKAKEAEASKKTHNCTVCGKNKTVDCELLPLPEGSPAKQFCSSSCLRVYKFSKSSETMGECNLCQRQFDLRLPKKSVFHEGVAQSFCSTRCQNVYVLRVRKITQCGVCKVKKYNFDMIQNWQGQQGTAYCSLICLRKSPTVSSSQGSQTASTQGGAKQQQQIKTIQKMVKEVQVFVKEPVKVVNKGTYTRPLAVSKGISCSPIMLEKGVQTEGPSVPALVPLTVPMYMPMPMAMYAQPYPVLIPVPVPVPVPVFVPTTRNSIRGIMKQIHKIQAKIPSDPFEAEILAMARALVNDQDDKEHSNDSDDEGEDSGIDCPVEDKGAAERSVDKNSNISMGRGQKRKFSEVNHNEPNTEASCSKSPRLQANTALPQTADAKHYLKFTYGVNAWKHWIMKKNDELVKARAQGQYVKEFEMDLLKLRADELNYTLSMFVKEVKKPNGDSYAPDSVLYLVLGIQNYLSLNGRIDNLFTDEYYDSFTSSLHEVIKDFKLPMNARGSFVTRIDEEHLWESKQLGAHTPQVLLNTLIYFNTKNFMLKTPEQHGKFTFSCIMKNLKKGQGDDKKNHLLRYFPQQSGKKGQERKGYEMHENEETPTRCPVKLYEFYLFKCSEASKKSSEGFYLQPERHCAPDSPLWFSNAPLSIAALGKVVQRFLMVREVQEKFLADSA